jgi:hypothetical protein
MEKDMKCEECKYFNVITEESTILECRRYAPKMLCGSGEGWSGQKWPHVYHDDWCGEFQPINSEPTKIYPSPYETAYKLGERIYISEHRLRRWAKQGIIPCLKLPNDEILFNYEEVIESLKKSK